MELLFLAGLDYLVGARDGRARYDRIMRACQQAKSSPAVREATGVVQVQAVKLFSAATRRIPPGRVG